MKKAFDQTVRDIKRGVNKKVLKVPSIEQKVLDATSNETWGPHGSLLADIAMASRNYHECQMIMSIIWKRINDTGKNWRHVYKGLTVLEYLVANGSERVIDEIREHAYQITSLSEFQYLDHNGKDQGSNVRKKSQSLVALVNDKEKIAEVRQKAAANWDKFHSTSGSVRNRPGSYPGAGGYEDDRYGIRDEDRNGYGREREWGDDKYGGSRDGDRYGEERYGRDRYRDDDYQGRRSVDNYARRSRSSDRDRERAYEDEGQYSSRGSNVKADEPNPAAPPSYEDAVSGGRSPINGERDGETKSSPAPAPATVVTSHETPVSSSPAVAPPPVAVTQPPPPAPPAPAPAPAARETNGFDEFDPRGSFQAAPPAEMDFFGSSSDPFSLNELAIVPVTTTTTETESFTNSNPPAQTFVAAPGGSTQAFDDPFGDGPFRAVPTTDGFSAAPPQSTSPFGQSVEPPPPQSAAPTSNSGNGLGFGGGFDPSTDILADLLPPSAPSQTGFQTQPGFTAQPNQTTFQQSFPGQTGQPSFQGGQPTPHQESQPMPQQGFPPQGGQYGFGGQSQTAPHGGYPSQMGPVSQPGLPGTNGQHANNMSNFYGGQPQVNPAQSYYQPPQQVQSGSTLNSSTGALALVPQQPAKFETKSTVWADTLNRGLVNLNIAGSKTNPLSDIGVDFEALNRKEKRMEKPSMNPVTSNVSMGKAMGSGSGIGRAGVGALRPQPNPMMGGPGAPIGYGVGYGNQPMGQYQMQPPTAGYPQGTYNPMMGRGGGYGQQPYGGGYR